MILCSVLDDGPVSLLVHESMAKVDHAILDRSIEELANGSPQKNFHAILASPRLVVESAILRQLSTHAPVIIVDDDPTIRKAVT